MIKTSVIIPVYNVEKYLDECIRSALQQTQKEIEIILVDDGSTDRSREKVRFYEMQYSCVKAIYQSNHKLGSARNAGVLKAEGKYIYFLDSDDYIDLALLEKCYVKSEKNKLDVLMFDSKVFIEENGIYNQEIKKEEYNRKELIKKDRVFSGKEFWKEYYKQGGIYTNAYLFYINRKFLLDNELFFIPEIFYEDNDWAIRLYKTANKVMYLSEQLYYRRIHSDSIMTSKYSDIHMKSIIIVCKAHANLLFNASDESEVQMIIPRYIGMLARFEIIFKQFIDERKVHIIKKEVEELYNEMALVFEQICEYDIQIGISMLEVIKLVEKEISKSEKRNCNVVFKCAGNIFDRIVKQIPLNKSVNLGLYGTGKRCMKFLQMYSRFHAEPIANLFFIDSTKESGFEFAGYKGYNVKDINKLQLDVLVITSTIYGDEMEQKAREALVHDIPVVRFPIFWERLYRVIFE